MKNRGTLIFMIVVLAFYGFSAWSQYTWHDRFKNKVGSDWIVVDEQKNAVDPIYPYTLFFPPISRLGLIQKSTIVRLGPKIYKYEKMWADEPTIGNAMPLETFTSFADCDRDMNGNIRKGVDKFTSLDDIEWIALDNNPYATGVKDKKRVAEAFKQSCLILDRD